MSNGHRYELDLGADFDAATNDDVVVLRPDYSGSSRIGGADLVAVTPDRAAFIEVKKRNQDTGKRSLVFTGSSEGQDGIEELEALIERTPSWAMPLVAIKWDHRQLRTYDASALLTELGRDEAPWGAHSTAGGNVSMRKPSTDEWPSATKGDDVEELKAALGLVHPDEREQEVVV